MHDKKLLGLHINSTAPFFARGGKEYYIEDFDLLTMTLSALSWRKLGNEILMVTDKVGLDYYKSIGITDLWDNVLDIIPCDLDGINPKMFWAAGKVLALREFDCPVCLIDNDFILWEMPELNSEIVAAHYESVNNDIYPPIDYFNMKDYIFPKFNWNVKALNTAFLYINNEDFKQFYTSQALYFMKSAVHSDDFLCYMVFAEQRLLSMCAEYTKIKASTLLDENSLWNNNRYTHIWGAKQAMRDNPQERQTFCNKCISRLERDFPEYKYIFDRVVNFIKDR
ncbi:MAG: hypothetical protein GX346_07520 [Clostridiales bacterium]|nr:hypothetical protein [Clostridiales bacterium]